MSPSQGWRRSRGCGTGGGKGGRRWVNPAGCGAARRQGAWDVRWDKKRPRLGCEPPLKWCQGSVGLAHRAAGPVAVQCQHRGCAGLGLGFGAGAGFCGVPQLPNSPIAPPGLTHPHSLPRAHAHGPRSTHTSPPRTHARLGAVPAGLGEDVWARKPFFSSCLLPPAGSSGHRERARASLLPHLEHTRAGQARCTPRSLVQTLKVA